MRTLPCLLGLLLALPAQAEVAAPAAMRQIVEQRLPDGRIVLTDRPLDRAETLRTWRFEPEDAQAAAERRAAAQREAAVVSERIARRLEQQRETDRELELARLQAARAAAEREAAQARAEAQAQQPVIWPHRGHHLHWPPHRPRPPGLRPPPQALPPGHALQRKAPHRPLGPNRHPAEWPH